jgi:hypothetical protein
MAGLVPAIHVFSPQIAKNVDARHKAGHDDQMGNAEIHLRQRGRLSGGCHIHCDRNKIQPALVLHRDP